jgi:hypothetical protein
MSDDGVVTVDIEPRLPDFARHGGVRARDVRPDLAAIVGVTAEQAAENLRQLREMAWQFDLSPEGKAKIAALLAQPRQIYGNRRTASRVRLAVYGNRQVLSRVLQGSQIRVPQTGPKPFPTRENTL